MWQESFRFSLCKFILFTIFLIDSLKAHIYNVFLGGDINAQLAIFHRGQNVNNVPFDSCGLWPSYYGHLGFPSRIQWRMSSLVQTRAHLVYQLMFYERFQILHVFETPSNNKSLNYKCYIARNSNELFFFSHNSLYF